MGPVVGIDLGTTNSCVAVLQGGRPLILQIDGGGFTMPSVVAYLPNDEYLVGLPARRQAATNPKNTIYAAKRLIGRSYDDPQTLRAIQAVPYQAVRGPNGDVRIAVNERTYAISEISAMVLARLKKNAEQQLEQPVTQAVVTVPAYFNDRQRQATKDAGQIAGLEVLAVLNEPTAAALAYGAHQGRERRVAIYDLGGGTFDVSVLKVGGGVIEVLASAGDAFLGGEDFDQRLTQWVVEQVQQTHGMSPEGDAAAMERIRVACEEAKIRLSDNPSTRITLPFLCSGPAGVPLHVDCELQRDQLEALAGDLIDRTLQLFVSTIRQAGLEPGAVDEVIFVGGMTRMPAVRRRIHEHVPGEPAVGVHPDLAVAVGAAMQAEILTGNSNTATVLLDVTPHNLGILSVAGLAETVIPKDSPVPVEMSRKFSTVQDDQRMVKIVVFQGNSRKVEQNEILGEFLLDGIRPAPRGDVTIEVRFAISTDGIVTVSAIDLETGRSQEIRAASNSGLSAEELQQMTAHQQRLANARIDGLAPVETTPRSGS